MQNEANLSLDTDFLQGTTWKVLSGGGYYKPYVNFVDLMWAAYRNVPRIAGLQSMPDGSVSFTALNLNPNATNYIQFRTNLAAGVWKTISTNVTGPWSTLRTNVIGTNVTVTNITGTNSFVFRVLPAKNGQSFYRVVELP
jgi:hypothetical protein